MKTHKWFALLSLLLVVTVVLGACAPATEEPTEPPAVEPTEPEVVEPTEAPPEPTEEPVVEAMELVLWTQEGEAEDAFQFVVSLTEAYTAMNPNVVFEVVNKNTEVLREDFQTAALAGASPDLLWTVNDHAGPFTAAELIQPVDSLVEVGNYVDGALSAVSLGGQTWGVPITSGNHLMLYYNKALIAEAPADTDALIAAGPDLIAQGITPLVYNQTEPFWLVPWLGGFGGAVFAEDGVTPTLNTPEMVATLQFLYDIKFVHNLVPAESDYDGADTLFKEGSAAMIINGDWTLGAYVDLFGEDLGVARIPSVVATGTWPAPYTSGKFFMIPVDLEGDKLAAVVDFVEFATNAENQAEMVARLNRLPALKEAMADPVISEDLYLKGSADQMSVGTAMPTVLEMRCNWDSMKPEMQAVLADTKTAEDAALAMQEAADTCIVTLE
jgi:arabinogalactan oligomer/maltooligosaccharide transport system substrate-binding protein